MCMFGLSEWMHKTWTHDSMNTNISSICSAIQMQFLKDRLHFLEPQQKLT